MRKPNHHRVGPGNPSPRIDPYAVDDTTITLEEWRRLQPRATARRSAPVRRRKAA